MSFQQECPKSYTQSGFTSSHSCRPVSQDKPGRPPWSYAGHNTSTQFLRGHHGLETCGRSNSNSPDSVPRRRYRPGSARERVPGPGTRVVRLAVLPRWCPGPASCRHRAASGCCSPGARSRSTRRRAGWFRPGRPRPRRRRGRPVSSIRRGRCPVWGKESGIDAKPEEVEEA